MMHNSGDIILIGYSGHSFVICDSLLKASRNIIGYCESASKTLNPFELEFLGLESEPEVIDKLKLSDYFIAIGDNKRRRLVSEKLIESTGKIPVNVIDSLASVSSSCTLGSGVFISNGCVINALSNIGDGVICNTNSTIEHECAIGKYSHIAPGVTVCGNVQIGENTLVGAGSVIKPGVTIGNSVIIGAGSVVVKDILSDSKVVGNPQKLI